MSAVTKAIGEIATISETLHAQLPEGSAGRDRVAQSLQVVQEALGKRKSREPAPFTVRGLDALPDVPPADIVQRLFGHGDLIAMVGAPNAGKTAMVVDLGLSIAATETWFDLKVAGGPVVYFAPEAPGSVIMRAKAAATRKYAERRLPFYVAMGTPQLGGDTSLADAERMIATIREVESAEGTSIKFAVVDTLASVLGNGEENGDGMIRTVVASKYIADTIGCAVMLIHHPSKGDAAGLRGHGSLAAACDVIIAISVDPLSEVRTATLTKSRDTATGLQLSYTLEAVTLGQDSFGDPRTTIIVNPTKAQQCRPRPSGKRQEQLLGELERRHRTGETGWNEAQLREICRTLGMPEQSGRDAVRGLMTAGYLWGQPAHQTLKYPPTDGRHEINEK